jgi:hypothetical protein
VATKDFSTEVFTAEVFSEKFKYLNVKPGPHHFVEAEIRAVMRCVSGSHPYG